MAPLQPSTSNENRRRQQGWRGSDIWKASKPFVTGALAGCLSATMMTPVDLVKVRYQASANGTATRHRGSSAAILRIVRETWREAGIRGFYAGISAVWARQIVYKGAVLGFYDTLVDRASLRVSVSSPKESKQLVVETSTAASLASTSSRPPTTTGGAQRTQLGLPMLCLCAGTAAALASVLGNPMDRALVLMQTRGGDFRHVFHALFGILRQEGLSGLFVGVLPTAARAVSLNISFLSGNSYLKSVVLPHYVVPKEVQEKHPYWSITVVSAVLAGLLSCVTSLPADYVKVRLQSQRLDPSNASKMTVLTCCRQIWTTQGLLGFYTGFVPHVVKQAPMATLTLLFQDALKCLWISLETPENPSTPNERSSVKDYSVAVETDTRTARSDRNDASG
ncbi:unnamed protein product, partial [Amoebophrya sp. A25]|eukprot:GSA25T00001942001.1